MSSEENAQSGKLKKNGKAVVAGIAVLVGVIIALAGVVIYLLVSRQDENQTEEKRNVVVTPDNVEEVIQQMELAEYVEPGYYTVSMTNEWHFATGDAASEDEYVENLAKNTNDVFFDVFLAGDEENAIYKSPVIPRGSRLENVVLDTPLAMGTYDCVLIYHLIDEEQNTVSTLRVNITIIIER